MLFPIVLGILLVGIGGILVFLARFLLNVFLPRFSSIQGILITKLIGLALVIVGTLLIFFIGIGELR